MRVLRAADHRVMPWKNGGGATTEIAVFPQGAGLDAFEWRISMATVASDGPFSLFSGIDRTLAVLEGEGIVLSVAGFADKEITRESAPSTFPADRTASARLIAGPVIDFNVMTRRARWMHRVERLSSVPSDKSRGTMVVLFCAGGSAAIVSDDAYATIGDHDAVIGEAGTWKVTAEASSELYLVSFDRAGE